MNHSDNYKSFIKNKLTSWTGIFSGANWHRTLNLEYRLLAVIVTICTKPMMWYGGILRIIVRIRNYTKSKFLKGILGLCLFPLFKLDHFLYKFLFLMQERQMLILERQCFCLDSKQMFANIRLDLRDCSRIVGRL